MNIFNHQVVTSQRELDLQWCQELDERLIEAYGGAVHVTKIAARRAKMVGWSMEEVTGQNVSRV